MLVEKEEHRAKMTRLSMILTVLATCLLQTTYAQFGFFDQMFGQQQQQQQQAQNVRSDSSWYQAQYEAGMCYLLLPIITTTHYHPISHPSYCHVRRLSQPHPPSASLIPSLIMNDNSTMHALPLPRHIILRPLPPPLSLRVGERGR